MDYEKEYDDIKEDYDDFLKEFKRTVEIVLADDEISTAFGIYGRLKSIDSILSKIVLERFVVKKSVTELNDLVGIRIVLLFPEFKDKVVDIITNKFQILNSYDNSKLSPDRFGYSSIHLILKIKDEWAEIPNWRNHKDKKMEMQIRTLSEHIWAETSHSLFYKREENIPTTLNRDLYRLSAILEIVDDKLQELKNKVEEHFNYIIKAPYLEILKLDLNSETFKRVMRENSKEIYNLDDSKNKMLSSRIEKEYNILNVNVLDSLIADKIDLTDLDTYMYIGKVINILEEDKLRINENKK